MKLLRLKITDPRGFRSLQPGFEYIFRTEINLQDEKGFAPFICAGPNGSGKSNLLEALAAIFYHLECITLTNKPDNFEYNEETNQKGFQGSVADPDAFELEYLVPHPYRESQKAYGFNSPEATKLCHIEIRKDLKKNPVMYFRNWDQFPTQNNYETIEGRNIKFFLPDFVAAYSSGENEILSLPFLKMRFIQFDEYMRSLRERQSYPGRPETNHVYLDDSFSQVILISNLLLQKEEVLSHFRQDVGIEGLKEFRIILRRSIPIEPEQLARFDLASEDERQQRINRIRSMKSRDEDEVERTILSRREIVNGNPALKENVDSGNASYRLNLLQLMEGEGKSSQVISALRRCATLCYEDEQNDSLILDYWVNQNTKEAFRENFENKPLVLFQALQVLFNLNLYSVSDVLKSDLYQSTSHYANETIPTLASDQRIMRFKFVRFSKQGVQQSLMLKELSDGEHQLLHSLGLCLLFRETNSLLLLDEPETHFNPDWRANFVTRLRDCLINKKGAKQEMLITTHSPFLISDSRPEKVLVFSKSAGNVTVSRPEYNTLGASINKITMNTFRKKDTVGGLAQSLLNDFRRRFEEGSEDKEALIAEIQSQLGDSVEKLLLIKAILGDEKLGREEGRS